MTATPTPGPGNGERSFFLDIVRGVSAQLVVVGHALHVGFPAFVMVDAGAGCLEARKGQFYAQNLTTLLDHPLMPVLAQLTGWSFLKAVLGSASPGLPMRSPPSSTSLSSVTT